MELRSKPVGEHSNQCIYRDSLSGGPTKFDLADKPPIAGTADYKAPGNILGEFLNNIGNTGDGHQTHDVKPFDLAAKLDGGIKGYKAGKPLPHINMYYAVRDMW